MASFQYVTRGEIEKAPLIADLKNQAHVGQTHKAGSESWTCTFAPDRSYFAWSCGNRLVRLVPWDPYRNTVGIPLKAEHRHNDEDNNNYMQHVRTIDCGEIVWAMAFGSSVPERARKNINIHYTRFNVGKKEELVLATGLHSGRIKTWDIHKGEILHYLIDHKEVIRDLAFAPDGSLMLVSASRDKTLKVWDLNDDGNMAITLKGHPKWVFGCCFSPDTKLLVSVGSGKSIILWKVLNLPKDLVLWKRLDGHYNDVVACRFSPDGALLATASWDTRVIVWDPYTGEKLKIFGHVFPPPSPIFAGGANDTWVRDVSFSPDGSHVASIADDKYVRFWSLFDTQIPEQIAIVPNGLCCAYSPGGGVLATGTRNGNVFFFAAPMKVQTLQHLCRIVIRKMIHDTNKIEKLFIPKSLRCYLRYKE
ncbi:WD repeat and SOCS box-containing protein 1-like [Saccoglossus kowalevskii]|uniref:WD repeat and SOCS box-containing protein 1-like isoform X2 n=1 Tax=Saccoglossus kowalevskii TaxID=10224 RepID=A0ABM0LVK6_SACKO|nr:PREDICTED: WD repeat and SOCS box-containing protein 1-like isoform X2 [Saccoglossus kowalevskii]